MTPTATAPACKPCRASTAPFDVQDMAGGGRFAAAAMSTAATGRTATLER